MRRRIKRRARERVREKETEREKERQRDRETERQRDRETERQRDSETERQRKTFSHNIKQNNFQLSIRERNISRRNIAYRYTLDTVVL